MACREPTTLISFATLLGPFVIVFVVLAFATDNWVEVDVDRTELTEIERRLSDASSQLARISFERHRGLLRECYPTSAANLFLDNAHNVVDDDCFYIDFDEADGNMSSDYKMRMHLIRSVLALMVLAVVGVIVVFILGLTLCIVKNSQLAHVASVLSCLSAMFVLTSIVLFHATEYVEANKDGTFGELVFHKQWSSNLLKATDSEHGWSYAMAWLGFCFAATDAVLYLLTARALAKYPKSDSVSSSSVSSSDRQAVVRKPSPMDQEVYDNYGLKAHGVLPMPMYYEGYPTMMQTLPAYPSMTYGNLVLPPLPPDDRA